jgi:hypothetical protein
VIIRLPDLSGQRPTDSSLERLGETMKRVASSPFATGQAAKTAVARAGASALQFLLRHPRLVAGTTLLVAVQMAAILLLRENTAAVKDDPPQVAQAGAVRPATPAPSADEAPLWSPPGLAKATLTSGPATAPGRMEPVDAGIPQVTINEVRPQPDGVAAPPVVWTEPAPGMASRAAEHVARLTTPRNPPAPPGGPLSPVPASDTLPGASQLPAATLPRGGYPQ